ncbi:MORN repeat-containing protein 2-like [Lingula anatina]|uniref:MORN repeat-containing protein 2-like n=1 Tax=Lingula anatina TaxID=7574 RepID=A0A1S3HD05_LINAN|nr:MORN repeat-containing protein 2-like [Lingula anatina]|eukprot:XP_013383908.1 MORN repeat-containing protein 2-like [Lingula anatina]
MPADKKKERKGDATPVVLKGIYIFPNGDKYDGEYTNKEDGTILRNGPGSHFTSEGVAYHGEWKDDKMTGKGRLEHPSGAIYEGDFVNNQFHGTGRYTWPNGSFYEGPFVENRLEGEGEFTDTDSQVWAGTFRYKAAPSLRFKLRL